MRKFMNIFDPSNHGKITRSVAAACFVLTASAGSAMAAEIYKNDPTHTEVRFGWVHNGLSNQTGEFDKVSSQFTLDREKPEASKVSVEIDINSISTGVPALDDHLKASDFFDAKKFPTARFETTSVVLTGEKTADLSGDLTIRDVTLPLTLKSKVTFDGKHPLAGRIPGYEGNWVAVSAVGAIKDPKAFGVGPFPVGEIKLFIDAEYQIQK